MGHVSQKRKEKRAFLRLKCTAHEAAGAENARCCFGKEIKNVSIRAGLILFPGE